MGWKQCNSDFVQNQTEEQFHGTVESYALDKLYPQVVFFLFVPTKYVISFPLGIANVISTCVHGSTGLGTFYWWKYINIDVI